MNSYLNTLYIYILYRIQMNITFNRSCEFVKNSSKQTIIIRSSHVKLNLFKPNLLSAFEFRHTDATERWTTSA